MKVEEVCNGRLEAPVVRNSKVVALKERLYREQIDGTTMFRALMSARLTRQAVVLDLGCGGGKENTDLRSESAFVVGCDISHEVTRNRYVSERVRGNCYALPFCSASFDLVFMDFVLEHLEDPERCASETFRVLKRGGYLVFRTPNLYHYVSVIGALTPHWFHQLIANRVRGLSQTSDHGVCRTYYRANTRRTVKDVFTAAGFVTEEIIMVEREPSYLMFARSALVVGYCYERLVNRYKWLSGVRSNIFGVMRRADA